MTISFPSDFPRNLTGFGGDPSMNQAQHQAALRKTPVILVHGNGGHSTHPKWGMETLKGFLKGEGYQDCEIWAMDHLGENNIGADLSDPHRNHIDALRTFVDRVREYLDVSKLDFIGHSLGCGMINAYLRGLQRDGRWDGSTHRLEVASTFVSLAGATYGLGPNSVSEFKSGSPFEQASHTIELPVHGRVVDDSPRGSGNAAEQQSPTPDWVKITTSDDNSICYVAFTAVGDFVDAQNRDTGRREGADVNRRFNLGASLDGHEKIIKSRTVFDAFKSFLNRNPPLPPATISVDKDSGSYGAGLEIRVTVAPATVPVRYVAERVTQQFQGGFIVRQVAETRSGKLASDQSLVLATDGAWDVVFGADGAKQVHRVYGVNVTMPQVTILTESDAPFVNGSLNVTASTTGGTLYHGTDGEHWTAGSVATITRTATVSFVAIDAGGVASPVASRAFEKPVAWDEAQTATLTAHFIASRLSVNDYVAMGLELGFNAVVMLYRVDGRWVRNPEQAGLAPRRALPALVPGVSPLRAPVAADREPLLVADAASGEYSGALNVTISTASPRGGRVKVWYTEDGSDPSDPGNTARASLDTQKTFAIRGNGHHSVLCYVRDSAGRHGFESFAWAIDDHQYPETGISPSLGGVYAGRVAVWLQSSEPCQWTKYTIDGTEPSDANGANCIPGQPIVIDKTTTLKFRSKDLAGNIEPVKAAAFTIEGPVTEPVFDNDPDRDG